LLNIEELARRLDIAVITIRRYVKRGMPTYKIGGKYRFNFDECLEWMKINK